MKPLPMFVVTFISFFIISVVIASSMGYHWGTPSYGTNIGVGAVASFVAGLIFAILFADDTK